MVLVMVGSTIIDRALSVITKAELKKVATTWRQAHIEAGISRSLQLSHTNSSKMGKEEEVSHSSPGSDPVEVQKFSLDDVRGPVCATQKVPIPPFSKVSVHANTSVKGHCMWVHVLTEPMLGPHWSQQWYQLWPMVNWILGPQGYLSACATWAPMPWKFPPKAVVGQVVPANQVPLVVHPTRTTVEPHNKSQKRMDLGAFGHPRSQRMAWIRAETGKKAMTQMGAPICTHQHGPRQNCSDEK